MMTAVGVLLLISAWSQTSESAISFSIAVLAALVLAAVYAWRLDRRIGIAAGCVCLVLTLLCWLMLSIGAAVGESRVGRPPMLMEAVYDATFLVMPLIVVAAALKGSDRRKGIATGVLTALAVGRSTALLVPEMELIFDVPTSFWSNAILIPAFAGALLGLDMGDYATRHPGFWRNRRMWAAVAIIAGAGLALRVFDIASGSFRAYTIAELVSMGQSGVLVRKISSSSNASVRVAAIRATGKGGGSEMEAVLIRRMQDPHADVRAVAAECLRYHISPKSVSALITALQDKDKDVQFAATHTLVESRDRRVFAAFVARLDDSRTRSAAITGLGRLGDGRAVPYLAKFLGYEWHASQAMWAIRDINDPSALETMLDVLECDDFSLWSEAAEIVSVFGGRRRICPAMIAHLDDERMGNRLEAIDLLRSYGDASVIPYLRKSAKSDPAERVRATAKATAREVEQRLR